MSTPGKPPSPTSPEVEPVIKVVSHTGLLYWWPVWLVGFILSGLTYFDNGRLAIVPEGTKVRAHGDKVYELTVPAHPSASLVEAAKATARDKVAFPVRVSENHNYGMIFLVVLLLVIVGSNVPLRGVWSLVAILVVVMVTMVLAYLDLWTPILEGLGALHVEISLAGYLVLSVVLLVVWLVVVFGFDQMRYMRFKAGQFTVHQEIGDAIDVYDTTRVTVRKRRSDLFRHWVLGLGAGDLVINIPNQNKEIILPNVAFVARRVQQIADVMKIRPITAD